MAPNLRKRMAPQEVKLWAHLRPLRSQGFHIPKQVPIQRNNVDFVWVRHRLVIEVDGNQHAGRWALFAAPHAMQFPLAGPPEYCVFFSKHGVDRILPAVMDTIFLAIESRFESVE